jgi:NADH dehydrogenase (ubiquinone) 1 alpha subcomplex subunit 2
VKELRFVFCQTSPHSKGIRQFILNNYEDIKSKNPALPFIVRECENAQPNVMARYEYGVERRIYLHNLEEKDVSKVVAELVE